MTTLDEITEADMQPVPLPADTPPIEDEAAIQVRVAAERLSQAVMETLGPLKLDKALPILAHVSGSLIYSMQSGAQYRDAAAFTTAATLASMTTSRVAFLTIQRQGAENATAARAASAVLAKRENQS